MAVLGLTVPVPIKLGLGLRLAKDLLKSINFSGLMGLFKQNHQNSHHVKKSFDNVKKDTSALFDWVNFLHQKIQEQEGLIRQQQKYLRSLHQYLNTNMITETHVKKLIDQPQKNAHILHHQIRIIHKKLDVMASLHDRHHTRINELHARLSPE